MTLCEAKVGGGVWHVYTILFIPKESSASVMPGGILLLSFLFIYNVRLLIAVVWGYSSVVERALSMREVMGSIPIISIYFYSNSILEIDYTVSVYQISWRQHVQIMATYIDGDISSRLVHRIVGKFRRVAGRGMSIVEGRWQGECPDPSVLERGGKPSADGFGAEVDGEEVGGGGGGRGRRERGGIAGFETAMLELSCRGSSGSSWNGNAAIPPPRSLDTKNTILMPACVYHSYY